MNKNKNKINIGSWIMSYNPASAKLMSSLGFNWLCIDLEHSTITFDQMEILISIIESNGSVPFVRVGANDKLYIKKALDAGAKGIIVPMINTVKEAKEAMNKKVKAKYFKEQVSVCREAGLTTATSLIIGYPQETSETIKETMTQLEKLGVYPSTGYLLPLPETGMFKHAVDNNYINDIDDYLTQIADRQDFSLNMTKMSSEDLKKETLGWLEKLNKTFGNQLSKDKLIKTGGEDNMTENQRKDRKIDRNKTNRETLNYATQEGTLR